MKVYCTLKKEQEGSEHCDECGARHVCDEVVLTSISEPLLASTVYVSEKPKMTIADLVELEKYAQSMMIAPEIVYNQLQADYFNSIEAKIKEVYPDYQGVEWKIGMKYYEIPVPQRIVELNMIKELK